jgi:hypothetical protein
MGPEWHFVMFDPLPPYVIDGFTLIVSLKRLVLA